MMAQIIITGGGETAAAMAHDLALRGFETSLFEKGELLSGIFKIYEGDCIRRRTAHDARHQVD